MISKLRIMRPSIERQELFDSEDSEDIIRAMQERERERERKRNEWMFGKIIFLNIHFIIIIFLKYKIKIF